MSTIVVQKYGGSSLADVGKVSQVAATIVERHRSGVRVAVVVSAMGKTTDELLSRAAAVSSQPDRRELDMLVTAGERISMALMSMAIHELGEDAVSFTGSQSGIVTESAHQGARIIEVRPHRIIDALERGRIVIVAGYQGVSAEREVTTLGRGGSDTSAVALAAALGADACEIYSDVDGVYSADPRLCPQAELLAELGYETMQTLAGSGAKVLNAQAVEFARRAEITLLARKTGDESGRETRVHAGAKEPPTTVHAVASAPAVTRLETHSEEWATLRPKIDALGGRILRMSVRGDSVAVWIDRTDVLNRDALPIREATSGSAAELREGAAVTVIGAESYRWLEDAQRALADANISVEGSMIGPADAAFFVEAEALPSAVQALHRALIEG
ncbi:MAG: aspartate kinase [Myxococcota bacterium]